MATTREERETELRSMSPQELLDLFKRLHGMPGGTFPAPGTLLVHEILTKEFPPEGEEVQKNG